MTRGRHLLTLDEVARLFRLFGGIDIVARLQLCKTPGERAEAFEAAKAEAKIFYRRLAMEHHPDRGGDQEKIKEVNVAWARLQKIEYRHTPQRKSALNIEEARGPQHTSVFVGVDRGPTWNTASSRSDMTPEKFREMIAKAMGDRTEAEVWELFMGAKRNGIF